MNKNPAIIGLFVALALGIILSAYGYMGNPRVEGPIGVEIETDTLIVCVDGDLEMYGNWKYEWTPTGGEQTPPDPDEIAVTLANWSVNPSANVTLSPSSPCNPVTFNAAVEGEYEVTLTAQPDFPSWPAQSAAVTVLASDFILEVVDGNNSANFQFDAINADSPRPVLYVAKNVGDNEISVIMKAPEGSPCEYTSLFKYQVTGSQVTEGESDSGEGPHTVTLSPVIYPDDATFTVKAWYDADNSGSQNGAEPVRYIDVILFKAEITEIHFDHNTSAMTDDGVTIKKDNDNDVTAPEWKPAETKNDPACYIKSKTPKVKVKLQVQPNSITTAKIQAVGENGQLPNLNQKTVTFSGGVSGLEEFTMANAISAMVTKISDSWQWKVSDINSSGSVECDADETGEHNVYVVLDIPKAPMTKPWTNVLELACHANWAGGQASAVPAVEAIGKAIYQSLAPLPHTINYDGNRPWYSYDTTQLPDEIGDGRYFHLTELFADIAAGDVTFACSCVANFYEIVIAAIGVDGQWKALDVNPNADNLDDYIDGGATIICKWYDPIGTPGWTSGVWAFHQVLLYNGKIFDACIKSDSNNNPVNHNPVWMLGLDETAYEGLLGSYDNNATMIGDTQLK